MTHRRLRVLVYAAALAAASCGDHSVEKVETAEPVPVGVDTAHVATLETTVSATGTIAPAAGGDWTISAPEPARIADLPKSEGQTVAPGDLLVRFDIPTLPADLAAKRAALDQATVAVDTAKAALTRATSLNTQGVVPTRDVEQAKQAVADATATLAEAKSAVTAADALDSRREVHAAFAGIVAKRWHNPGDLVDATVTDPILRIINPTALQVVASVPVADLPRVAIGREARIVGPAGGDGDVAHVTTKPGQVEPGSPTADVRLAFAAPTKLAAGTMVSVTIAAETRPHVLVAPEAAVVHDDDATYVMVAGSDGKAHKHDVKLGLTASELVEISSGLSDGDRVIVRGQDGLPDGAAITVVK